MDLFILTAGKADKTWTGSKADRPLRTKGKRQAQKIGAWLARTGLRPDKCYAEPGLRSQVTAEKALKAGGGTAETIGTWTPHSAIPGASERLLLVVRPKTARNVLRGFTLNTTCRPGTLIHIALHGPQARLVQSVMSNSLPDLFPYPGPDGPDHRERPAYYYTQSAAIPYRGSGRDTQILIVGSSSRRHWVVPKGIVEPGLSPAGSAAVEAREEAGVLGPINPTPIGEYTYQKWGADCHVTVFAMKVMQVIPDSDWEENHRERRWVSRDEAIALLKQTQLHAMIARI